MNEHTMQLRTSLQCMVVYVMDHCMSRTCLHADYTYQPIYQVFKWSNVVLYTSIFIPPGNSAKVPCFLPE